MWESMRLGHGFGVAVAVAVEVGDGGFGIAMVGGARASVEGGRKTVFDPLLTV